MRSRPTASHDLLVFNVLPFSCAGVLRPRFCLSLKLGDRLLSGDPSAEVKFIICHFRSSRKNWAGADASGAHRSWTVFVEVTGWVGSQGPVKRDARSSWDEIPGTP